jgi:selenocysteine insertion sequence-binding protein 2
VILPTIFSKDISSVTFAHHQAVVLSNILSDDDMEDEECLDECKEDILSFVRKYGEVSRIDILKEGRNVGNVLITYASSCADAAAAELNGLKIGGKCIRAEIAGAKDSFDENDKKSASLPLLSSELFNNNKEMEAVKTTNNLDTSEPMFSKGGKLIPERWAECKRVPKIGSCASKPVYVQLLDDDAASQLLFDMLGSLMSYQLRSKDDVNARSRRRLVLGFREVARGLRANKIKLVVLANNLDEYEAVGEKTQEVLDACQATGTPILFELSKRQLGKALGKTIKVSVVGVQNVDGAHEQFKKLKALAENISNVID